MSKILRTGNPPLNKLAGRGMTWSLHLRKENQAANTKTRTTLDVTINTYYVELSSSPLGSIYILQLMLPFGSHGVTHPTQQRRSPCPSGSAEDRKAPMDLGSAGESLDGGELD
jgi:hypothetical protein